MNGVITYHSYFPGLSRVIYGKASYLQERLERISFSAVDSFTTVLARLVVGFRKRYPTRFKYHSVSNREFSLPLFYARMARAYASFALVILLVSYAPSLWYVVASAFKGDRTAEVLAETVSGSTTPETGARSKYQPKFDPTLSEESRLVIPTIGVDTQVQEATLDNYEDALREGVWRVSDFGTPYGRSRPTILSAHRYGYLKWSNLHRRQNSFYNLPKLSLGDTVEIIWRQRKYVYEVYGEEKGEEITNYSADLILYTCEDLNSPTKIIKYARLLEI